MYRPTATARTDFASQVKEGLLNLARSLREKFQKIGVESLRQ